MKIVCLNAWGGARYTELVQWLCETKADVFCFQEVTHTPDLVGWTRFEDSERVLPQRASLFGDLKNALPDHQGFFLSCDAGPVNDSTGTVHRQDFGLAMFVHQRLSVIAKQSDYIHGKFSLHSEWPTSARPRIASSVQVFDHDSNRIIAVTHLHGLRDAAGKGDTPARLQQAKRLADSVKRIGSEADFSVVCGDFNVLPDSETFRILSDVGFTDLVGTQDTRTELYTKPLRHANYMLVSDPGAVEEFSIPAKPVVSDHRFMVLVV
ncbi:MAG: endonuclease/exonuclease/phosphatase family protein [Pseudomonadota bacterium]